MMRQMRTTVTLEPDVAAQLKQRAHHQGISFKDALNRTLRAGLGGNAEPRPFVQVTASLGLRPGIDLDRAGRLVDEFEDAERVRKLELRK
ncbi:antitoxin [soil metagenome]